MNNEIVAGIEYLERERNIRRDVLIKAIELAVIASARKAVGPARELQIQIDPKTLDIKAFATLKVVERVIDPHSEITLSAAQRTKPDAQLEEDVVVPVPTQSFGRIAAQAAKQALMQELKKAEREKIYDEFKDRAGEIISGTVRRFERQDVILDLGKFEATMPGKERVPTEDYAVGDRIRAYVVEVQSGSRGTDIILSRSHPNFVRKLFEMEVSEIADRTVEIKGIAREAGFRTKIAVHSADGKVDPVGACVGMKGSRVKNIVRELNNEKVDIIKWSADTEEFALEALKPAKVKSVKLDPAKKAVHIKVDEDQLSLAIGKRGQNARLTSRLVGWDINISKDESKREEMEHRKEEGAHKLADELGISEELAMKLTSSGMNSLDVILSCEASDIAGELAIDEAAAQAILDAAGVAKAKSVAATA